MSIKYVPKKYAVGLSQHKLDKVNSGIPSKLATMFYISKTNRVSYYSQNSWGDLMVWNKGAQDWEYCPSMLDKELYSLPAQVAEEAQELEKPVELVQPNNAVQTNSKVILDESVGEVSLSDEEENSLVEITKVTVAEAILNPSKKDLYDLRKLYYRFLPENYFVGLPPEGEVAYFLKYADGEWSSSQIESVDYYIAGALYTNSYTCVSNVASYLNKVNATFEQLI